MSIKLNHLIVFSQDKETASAFFTETFRLAAAKPSGPFLTVQMDNEVTLDFFDSDREIVPQHLAFLVSDTEFDAILSRIRMRVQPHWADPFHQQPNQINREHGGRGLYIEDPSGHNLEILTKA